MTQITGPQLFHTRVKLVEKTAAQSIPAQIIAPRPPYLANVKLGIEEEEKAAGGQNQSQFSQSFLVIRFLRAHHL